MNDKELLEWAAKGANLDIEWRYSCFYLGGDEWWPLEDDGDALRLAVKLAMLIDMTANCTMVSKTGEHEQHMNGWTVDKCHRRAITRAAAEIGLAM